ncbi:DgyrCDS11052 [Dimorphilus gyrociliatus]|uniref:DgyrCDS11052 n=1 Tax=Dimorphilus gyrociliatus TaxID=2664684 RepID=A0A7I8W395_9ANNE|nr:DgyrCDS11052 [Dimorphilus gyrociliatus]
MKTNEKRYIKIRKRLKDENALHHWHSFYIREEQYLSNNKASDDRFSDISEENVSCSKISLSRKSLCETSDVAVVKSAPETKKPITSKEKELKNGDDEINIEIKDDDLTHLPDISFISEPQNDFPVDDLVKETDFKPHSSFLAKESKRAVIEQLIRTMGKETKSLNGRKIPNIRGVNNPVFIVEDEYDA